MLFLIAEVGTTSLIKGQSTNLTEVEEDGNSRGKNKHIHSYRFPKDKVLFEKWKMLSQEKNGSPAIILSFVKNSFYQKISRSKELIRTHLEKGRKALQRCELKPDAVPSQWRVVLFHSPNYHHRKVNHRLHQAVTVPASRKDNTYSIFGKDGIQFI